MLKDRFKCLTDCPLWYYVEEWISVFGLGKPRSIFGKFIDRHNILQERIREVSGVSRDTLTRVCSDPGYMPSGTTMSALLKAVRSLTGVDVTANDFWPM